MRSLLLSGLLLSTFTGCARPVARAAKAPAASDASTLIYAVGPAGRSEAAVLEGRTSLGDAPLKVQTHKDGASSSLELQRVSREDGRFDVEASYTEHSADQRTIKWRTVVRLAPGGAASAKVAGDGFARELLLRAE